MGGGYVLAFSDATFGHFFKEHGVEIHGVRYQTYGGSKANKMRAFWNKEPDKLVGRVLSELLDDYEALCELGRYELDAPSFMRCKEIVARLTGVQAQTGSSSAEAFLNAEFQLPDFQKLPVDFTVSAIIEDRLKEAQTCLKAGAHLSVIFQCGSILEAVLLGAAQQQPEQFNRSTASPKRDGKVKPFPDWSLAEFINVAHDIDLLKSDVQKFSHGLRDFRNYIHPYEQVISGFTPDEYTAKVCLQVLRAALADVSGER